jgi:hypothetical protein
VVPSSGIPTFWSPSHPGKTSTIDLTVTDSPERLIRCGLYYDHYGSAHQASYSEWSLHPKLKPDSKPKRNFDRADWEKIGLTVQTSMNPWPTISSDTGLGLAVEELVKLTTNGYRVIHTSYKAITILQTMVLRCSSSSSGERSIEHVGNGKKVA